MSIHITQIEKHRFVCGLFWQSLSRPRELAKEAADLAKKIDFDLMVLRKDHTTAQAGFALAKDGARKMMYSLAAAVSKAMALEGAYYDGEQQPVHNWLAAFKLPDGMWAYFAVRDANFLPNGDFAGTKEEVMERLHGDYGLGGWNLVIGDAELEEYGFHNFSAKRIEDILPRKRNGHVRTHRWWGLQPVKSKVSWRVMAVGGSVVILAGAAGTIYWQKYQQKKADEERERAIEAVRRQMQWNKAPPTVLPHPWAFQPSPRVLVRACMDKMSYLTPGGWRLENYTCTPGQVSYAWSRNGSTIDFLLAQVPDAVTDFSGEKASYVTRLELAQGTDEVLKPQKEVLQPLISKMQLLGVGIRLNKEQLPAPPPASPTLPGMATAEPPKPDWQTFVFALNVGGMAPSEIAEILSQPGVRISKLTYQGGAWSIEGVAYAK